MKRNETKEESLKPLERIKLMKDKPKDVTGYGVVTLSKTSAAIREANLQF